MIVTIDELETYFELLIKACKKQNMTSFTIDADYYWLVAQDERCDFKKVPTDLNVGSLVDDVDSLKKLLSEPEILSPVDIDRLANVLNALSDSIEKSNEPWLFL